MPTFRNTWSDLTPTRALFPSHTCPWPPCRSSPCTPSFCTLTHPYPVTLLPVGSGYFRARPFPVQILQLLSNLVILHTYLLTKMEQTECSETSAYKIQTPGNYPEGSIQRVHLTVYFGMDRKSLEAFDIATWGLLSLPLLVAHLKTMS